MTSLVPPHPPLRWMCSRMTCSHPGSSAESHPGCRILRSRLGCEILRSRLECQRLQVPLIRSHHSTYRQVSRVALRFINIIIITILIRGSCRDSRGNSWSSIIIIFSSTSTSSRNTSISISINPSVADRLR